MFSLFFNVGQLKDGKNHQSNEKKIKNNYSVICVFIIAIKYFFLCYNHNDSCCKSVV